MAFLKRFEFLDSKSTKMVTVQRFKRASEFKHPKASQASFEQDFAWSQHYLKLVRLLYAKALCPKVVIRVH